MDAKRLAFNLTLYHFLLYRISILRIRSAFAMAATLVYKLKASDVPFEQHCGERLQCSPAIRRRQFETRASISASPPPVKQNKLYVSQTWLPP